MIYCRPPVSKVWGDGGMHTMGKLFGGFVLAFAMLAITACSSSQLQRSPEAAAGSPAVRQQVEYTLGTGDELRVNVFGEQNLSGTFVVDGTGQISMPLIGQIRASDLTVRQFESEVERRLKEGYLNSPQVSAEVLNYRPYYILGEVSSSGTYPYSDGLTVLNAVATAGGFTYRANTRRVFIKRQGAANEEEFPLTADIQVQPGDTIRIAERFF